MAPDVTLVNAHEGKVTVELVGAVTACADCPTLWVYTASALAVCERAADVDEVVRGRHVVDDAVVGVFFVVVVRADVGRASTVLEIGRASCRERV